MTYEKHPLNSDEAGKILALLRENREFALIKRCLEATRDTHYLNALRLHMEGSLTPNGHKQELEAGVEQRKGDEAAKIIRTLDTMASGDYEFFTIRVNS